MPGSVSALPNGRWEKGRFRTLLTALDKSLLTIPIKHETNASVLCRFFTESLRPFFGHVSPRSVFSKAALTKSSGLGAREKPIHPRCAGDPSHSFASEVPQLLFLFFRERRH